MHDIKAIRADPAAFDAAMRRRGVAETGIVLLGDALRTAQSNRMEQEAWANRAAREIGQAMAAGNREEAEALKAEVTAFKSRMASLLQSEGLAEVTFNEALASLPNQAAPDVPDGHDETGNVVIHTCGDLPAFDFAPKEHDTLALRFGYDPDAAAAISGARFAFLKGPLARLHRALGQFMLDANLAAGWTEVAPPLLVREAALFGTGQLPKFEDDLFSTRDNLDFSSYVDIELANLIAGNAGAHTTAADFVESLKARYAAREGKTFRRYLIPTAEVSLTNSIRGRVLDADELPLRLTALTPCFRAEAGSAGRDTRGLIRQHQFDKVELVAIVADAEAAGAMHEEMTAQAESLLDALGLPYRRMLLCAGDMGFAARKTYDLEVWLPGQNAYREISSISDCGDFQARRMDVDEPKGGRFKVRGQKGTAFVHTLNGSALAVGRTLVAVIENYQRADGSVRVPDALLGYMGGVSELLPSL